MTISQLFGRKTPSTLEHLAVPPVSAIIPAELRHGIEAARTEMCRLQAEFAAAAYSQAIGGNDFTTLSITALLHRTANRLACLRRELLDADPRAYALLRYGLPAVLESEADGADWDRWRVLTMPTLDANGATQ